MREAPFSFNQFLFRQILTSVQDMLGDSPAKDLLDVFFLIIYQFTSTHQWVHVNYNNLDQILTLGMQPPVRIGSQRISNFGKLINWTLGQISKPFLDLEARKERRNPLAKSAISRLCLLQSVLVNTVTTTH